MEISGNKFAFLLEIKRSVTSEYLFDYFFRFSNFETLVIILRQFLPNISSIDPEKRTNLLTDYWFASILDQTARFARLCRPRILQILGYMKKSKHKQK